VSIVYSSTTRTRRLTSTLPRYSKLQSHYDHEREEGCQDFQDQVQPVPHRRTGRRAQARAQPLRFLRASIRYGRRVLVLRREQEIRNPVGRRYPVRVPAQPQEVHQGAFRHFGPGAAPCNIDSFVVCFVCLLWTVWAFACFGLSGEAGVCTALRAQILNSASAA